MGRVGIVRCALAAVLFGISAPTAARLTDELGAFTLAGALYLGAALAVLPVVGRVRPSRRALRRSGPGLAVAVVIGGAVAPVLLAVGLGLVPPATSSLLLNLELVFTTVLAALVFGEHVGGRVVAGTALVLVAGLLLSWSGEPDLRWGAIVIALACFGWAIDNSVTAALDDLAPSVITFAKGTIAGGVNLVIGLSTETVPDLGPLLAALVVGAFGYGVSITLWVSGARELGAARAQLVFATAPFVGAVVAWTIFGDDVTTRAVVATVIAAAGVAFVLRSDHEHEHRHAAVEHDHEHTHDDGHHDGHHGRHADGQSDDGMPVGPRVRHTHRHAHASVAHHHPHVPDLHHRHVHAVESAHPDGA
jgi:drug/metabolite transporter (DMT)-like permease